ncbi:prolipoprotein diacylglyceryl transferase [Thiothrix nivea]|uniref:Phosphatidylglycerol--prolipoprotein diacylglyceryl transferase n=1 Tax=Thiothrix nivea (strain ATCC 35100 / DSM 5205 / JP2) TaxID=870187 RepID=A0A656HD51_THINJ|nr:prolipoprotein diacylglyceryl transferase [Thiothrix nivea]EIJ33386.1 Prolipoprotein diacylglyceryl transferase [Thiothrix nivea DSM 5205]
MLVHPDIDPIALSIGPLKIHWYGLMYVVGFLGFLIIGKMRSKEPNNIMNPDRVDDMMFWGAIGVVAGGRIGYMLFYNLQNFLADPLSIFQVWDGGMSFHGGLLGVILAMIMLARRWGLTFFQLSDFVAPLVPIGLGAGRIGNFINGELWGRATDVPWGMVFPQAQDGLARHPSQLYQAFLEGLVLFLVLNWFRKRSPPTGAISGLFLVGYGIARILVEFVREPDKQLGYVAWGWVTQGQVLSLPMVFLGLLFMWWAYKAAKR